ncbi:MAG: hypothetical protein LBV07_02955, partial [Syntrophobacterales bacterium]|nr:hypothetical protein [Syntrophobacterales bacterium]
ISARKEYRATALLGVCTDTLDVTGTVVATAPLHVAEEDVIRSIHGLRGRRKQIPPLYSAVKFKGRSLHRWARRGIVITPEPRDVEIFHTDVVAINLPEVVFTISCSKGTYIRSLCADIGEELGCGAALSSLRRTKNGSFSEGDALLLAGLDEDGQRRLLAEKIIPVAEAVSGLKAIHIDDLLADKIRKGCQLMSDEVAGDHISFLARGDMVRLLSPQAELVAIVEILTNNREEYGEVRQLARTLRVFGSQNG